MNLEELDNEEKKLLLKAFNYEVDEDGFIKDKLLDELLISRETKQPIHLKNAALTPGSLKIFEATSVAISKFLRQKVELNDNGD